MWGQCKNYIWKKKVTRILLVYNFDNNGYFDISMKRMDAQEGISSDISRAIDAHEVVQLFMGNEYAWMVWEDKLKVTKT